MKAILRSINNFSCKLKQINNLKYNISPKIRSNKFKSISGNGNITIEDAIKKDLKDYKVYGNIKQKVLPDEYTQVDYIESSETGSYINTNYYPTSDTTIELDYKFVRTTSSTTAIPIMGERPTYESKLKLAIWVNPSSNRTALNFGDYDSGYVANSNPKVRNVITTDNSKLYYNGNLVASSHERTFSRSSLPIYLFGLNEKGSILHRNQVTQLYSLKIYEKNSLVRNFIPCYRNSDNEVGLYDLVNNVFYTNQGTGVFTYGSVAPTPDTPIDMVSCGDRTKNLLNIKNIVKGRIDDGNIYYQNNTTDLTLGKDSFTFTTNANWRGVATDYIEVEPLTIYMLSYNSNSVTRFFDCYDENKNWIGRKSPTNTSNNWCKYETLENTKYIRISWQLNLSGTITISYPQIEKGSVATEYEPYGYKIPVNVRSDNLFNKDDINIEDNKYLTSDGSYSDNSNFKTTDYIPIKSSIIYNLSPYRNYSAYECFYDENKTFISSIQIKNINNTFTTPSNAKYIRLSVRKTDNDGLMLVEGSTTPDKYIPYYNETTNIYLDEPLRKIGNYADYIDFKNSKVVRNIKEIVLDGSEDWYTSSGTSQVAFNKGVGYIHDTTKLPCNISSNCQMPNNNLYFYSTGYSLADWKTFLSITNAIVYGRLSTSTEEDIELPNIKLIEGKNIITIGTEVQGVFEVEYYSKEIIDISNYKYNLRKVED